MKLNSNSGFTLVELLAVMAVIAIVSSVLILNFRSASTNATARQQVAYTIVSDIRRAQELALAGADYNSSQICGYGISYNTSGNSKTSGSQKYMIYAGAFKSDGTGTLKCLKDKTSRRYDSNNDYVVEVKNISNQKLEIKGDFCSTSGANKWCDVFFESPGPKTYVCSGSQTCDSSKTLPNLGTATIQIGVVGKTCAQSPCTNITITTSGKIDVSN